MQTNQTADASPASAPTIDSSVEALLSRLGPLSSKLDQTAAIDPEEEHDAEAEADAKPVDPVEAAEQFLEWDGADGKPERVSLTDAMSAYQERTDLQKRMGEMTQRQAQMPQEIEAALLATAQTRQQLITEAERLQQTFRPQQPSRDLLNRQSPNYDPEQYGAQMEDYERGVAFLQQVEQGKQQQQHTMRQEFEQVQQAAMARGRHQLEQAWPEVISDPATRQGLAELLQHVGFDPSTALDAVTDPRAYLVMKLAMQGLKAEAQAKVQLKAVKSVPRLVRGAGRTPATQESSSARSKFEKTGTMDDAINFLMSRQGK